MEESRDSELTGLADLKKFLSEELGDSYQSAGMDRAFQPLTDGLGLESPKRKSGSVAATESVVTAAVESPATAKKSVADVLFGEGPLAQAPLEPRVLRETVKRSEPPPVPPALERATESMLVPPADLESAELSPMLEAPPAMPSPGLFSRLLSAVVDQALILTAFATFLLLAANVRTSGAAGFSSDLLKELRDPAFLRLAVAGFAGLWLGYLVLALTVAGRTFGMWAWNIKVAYGAEDDDLKWLRRTMRIFWSFCFYAPVVPLFVLAIRVGGKNLLDLLSGTHLYRE